MEKILTAILAWQEINDFTDTEVAAHLGIAYTQYYKWRKEGVAPVKIEKLPKIAVALRMEIVFTPLGVIELR